MFLDNCDMYGLFFWVEGCEKISKEIRKGLPKGKDNGR
jgi:hypothetical protein